MVGDRVAPGARTKREGEDWRKLGRGMFAGE